jgi:hypothetical protein
MKGTKEAFKYAALITFFVSFLHEYVSEIRGNKFSTQIILSSQENILAATPQYVIYTGRL